MNKFLLFRRKISKSKPRRNPLENSLDSKSRSRGNSSTNQGTRDPSYPYMVWAAQTRAESRVWRKGQSVRKVCRGRLGPRQPPADSVRDRAGD